MPPPLKRTPTLPPTHATTHPHPPAHPWAADARLQPRDTRLTAAFLLLFACAVAGAVFVAVPRGVSVGEISVKTDRMSWNTTKARGRWVG